MTTAGRADPPIHGEVAPGFEAVAEAFSGNFAARGELGAAVAAFVGPRKVVDLWGGVRDAASGAPWEGETIALLFSTTKGLAAMAIAVAHARGLLDLDAPVARYWPEFAAAGKERIPVRDLLAHRAGLAVIDAPLDAASVADLDGIARVLAAQRPHWPPGSAHGYHAFSLGMYQNELIRRVDPAHRTLRAFLRDEIAAPLGIELHIALPHGFDERRVAAIETLTPATVLMNPGAMPWAFAVALMSPASLTRRAVRNPAFRSPAEIGEGAWRHIALDSANGFASARSVARAYAAFASGGAEIALTPATLAELAAAAPPPPDGPRDLVLLVETAYALGFMKPSSYFRFGTDGRAFGSPGSGGSFGFADPATGLGFAYVPNRMGPYLFDDPREKALRDAVHACLKAAPPPGG